MNTSEWDKMTKAMREAAEHYDSDHLKQLAWVLENEKPQEDRPMRPKEMDWAGLIAYLQHEGTKPYGSPHTELATSAMRELANILSKFYKEIDDGTNGLDGTDNGP